MKLLDTTAAYTYHCAWNTYICTKSPGSIRLDIQIDCSLPATLLFTRKKELKVDLSLILPAVFHVSTGQTSQ